LRFDVCNNKNSSPKRCLMFVLSGAFVLSGLFAVAVVSMLAGAMRF